MTILALYYQLVGGGQEQGSKVQRPVREHVILTAWFFDSPRTATADAGSDRCSGTRSHVCRPTRSLVSGVVKGSSCRSIMLRQEELAFIKAISTLQLSPALLSELRMFMSRRNKKPVVLAGSRDISGDGARAPPTVMRPAKLQAQSQRAGKLGRVIRTRKTAPSA